MSKVMKNRTDNDIKNKWNSMQRTEGREAIAASTSPMLGVDWSHGHRRHSSAYRSEFEAASWKPREHPRDLSKTMPFQPFSTANTSPSHSLHLLTGMGIPAVVTDGDNANTTARTGLDHWENKLQF
jgi:hypothetical protein